jgi:CRP/FNR family transcriptional regulator
LEKFSKSKACIFVKDGDHIFQEGKYPSGIFCIHKGKIKLSYCAANNRYTNNKHIKKIIVV